ncbi:MAG: hypothetical protein GY832_19705 [Chloroflexi bacterium]|nr:hypothetical protein [Chloroflexota bacterium]
MNAKKILLWTIPLLIIPSLLCTILLQRFFDNRKQAGWIAEHLQGRAVNDLLFDAQHRAWAATNWGVSVFDGDDWTTYTAESDGLPSDQAYQIVLDHQGRIWTTTDRGIGVFDGTGWTSYASANSSLPAGQGIAQITLDRQDRTWVYYPRSRMTGVSLFDGQTTWITYTTDNSGLVSNWVSTVAFDAQNRAWIGTKEGLSLFDGETWTTYTTENSGLLHNHIFTIAFDRQNRAWIGAEGELNVFDGQTASEEAASLEAWLSYPIDRSPVTGNQYGGPYVIAFDEQNRAWVGVHDGANVLDGTSGELLLRDGKYTVKDVILTQEQVWLIPSRSRGIRVFAGETWSNYTSANSALPTSAINAHSVDREGHLWLGSRKGITVVNLAETRPLSDGAVAISRFLSWGGHLFLPIIIIGLWLGLWRDALPGVVVGIGVGLFIFLLGIVGSGGGGEIFLVLGCIGTITGIMGGLVASIILQRKKATPTEEAAPAGSLASTVTGILGGGGCAIMGVIIVIVSVVLSCIALFFVMMKFGIGMQ